MIGVFRGRISGVACRIVAACAALALASAATSGPVAAAPAVTAQDIEAYVDGVVHLGMAQGDIAGGVVTVVKDGRILFSKGYGKADVARAVPVRADRTLFRIGSVTKPFTAIAAMQLVERGKLDLDVDVQRYLDFKLPARKDSGPITLRHLLTHTAGFEESYRHIFTENPGEHVPLAPYMRENAPQRMNPAGKTISYSNYGSSLIGYIVQRVSGVPWDVYVRDNILRPIGMTRSSAAQPLPPELARDMSRGYLRASQDPGRFEFVGPAPAGSISATGDDMGRYMIAMLGQGRVTPALLSPAGFTETFRLQKTAHPSLWGIGLIFLVQPEHGQRVVWHNGGTNYFLTNMHLMLDRNIGVFSTFNTIGNKVSSAAINDQIWDGFLDRYFPVPEPVLGKPLPSAREHARSMAGDYLSTRRPDTSFAAVLNLLGSLKVKDRGDGTLEFFQGPGGAPWRWQEIEPFVWQRIGGTERIAGERDAAGRVTGLSLGFSHLDRVDGLANPAVAMPLMLASLGVLLVASVAWIWAGVRRTYRRVRPARNPIAARSAGDRTKMWRATRVAVAVGLVGLFGFFVVTSGLGEAGGANLGNNATLMIALRVTTMALAIGALLATIHAIGLWRTRATSLRHRLSVSLLALAATGLSLVLWRYHVFGFSGLY